MGEAKKNWKKEEFHDFLRQLIDNDELDDDQLEVINLVIEGEDLDEDQDTILQDIKEEFVTEECSRCNDELKWSEMYEAYGNEGKCTACLRQEEKGE